MWKKYHQIKRVLKAASFGTKRILMIHQSIEGAVFQYNLATHITTKQEHRWIDRLQKSLYRAALGYASAHTFIGGTKSVGKLMIRFNIRKWSQKICKKRVGLAQRQLTSHVTHPGRRVAITRDDEICGPIGKQVPVRGVRRLPSVQQVANEAQMVIRLLHETMRQQYLIRSKHGMGRVLYKKLPLVVMEQGTGQERRVCGLHNQEPPDATTLARERDDCRRDLKTRYLFLTCLTGSPGHFRRGSVLPGTYEPCGARDSSSPYSPSADS